MRRSPKILSLALLLLCGAASAQVARADVKIKTKSTSDRHTSEQTTYIKGKRQRSENGEASVMITQCDARRTIQLGVPTKTYVVTSFDQRPDETAAARQDRQQPAGATETRRGGIVTSTYTTTDTGERKKMFGYTARRIKTIMITESSPDACQVSRSRVESDGWYIDAAFALDCDEAASAAFARSIQTGGCRDQYRTKQVGTARLGYPALVTTTLFDESGKPTFTFTMEVVEISNAVLDSALFEAPADYRQVTDMSELYGAPASASSSSSSDDEDGTTGGSANGSNGASDAGSRVSRKRAGVLRVGVTQTETGLTGEGMNAEALAQAVRRALVNNLNNATIEVVSLDAAQPQQAEAEAQRKECDFVLYSTVAHKKGGGGGGFGGFLKKSAAIASGTVSSSGESSAGASPLKAKDEVTLEYRLQRGTEPVVANTLKAKAKSDGDDVISQLAGQAAAAVRAAVATTK